MDGFSATHALQSKPRALPAGFQWVTAMGVAEDLAAVPGLTILHLECLAARGVRALDQLADLASDELQEILGSAITPKRADEVILTAREHWWTEQN